MSSGDGLVGRLSLRRAARSARHAWYGSASYHRSLSRQPQAELRRALPLRPVDTSRAVAEAVLEGRLPLAGRIIPFGTLPWTVPPPGPRAAEAMHGFRWLLDLKTLGTRPAQARAQDLIRGWMRAHARWNELAWTPGVIGRRLVAWILSADFVLTDADEGLRTAYLRSLSMQAHHLVRDATHESGTSAAFAAVGGRLAAAFALEIGDVDGALDMLERELEIQIFADGCHIQRNPSVHLTVLRDLLDIRAMLVDAEAELPLMLSDAMERMVAMLRFFRHGDGGLALFHGGKEDVVHVIDATLAEAGVKERPPASAPTGAFERLAAGPTLILVDAGGPPPAKADRLAHAAPGAFELSVGRERLIVNCGGYAGDDSRWQTAMRSTAAHSTTMIDTVNAVPFEPSGGLHSRQFKVGAIRRDADGATWLEIDHNGYAARFSATCRRRLYIDALGEDIRGEDICEGGGGERLVARFHLHPDVEAAVEDEATGEPLAGIRLTLPSGGIYRFISIGGPMALEDSVYLGTSDMPRPARQIVIGAPFVDKIARIKWALRRVEQGSPADQEGADAEVEPPEKAPPAREPAEPEAEVGGRSQGRSQIESEAQPALDLRLKEQAEREPTTDPTGATDATGRKPAG